MKLLKKMKDGGPDSTVTGYWLCEIKSLFSIVLLKFEGKSREAYHTHAFHALSWVLKGLLIETVRPPAGPFMKVNTYFPSVVPFITRRETMHQVNSKGTSWVLSIRGPWCDEWQEYLPDENKVQTLTHGRVVKNKS